MLGWIWWTCRLGQILALKTALFQNLSIPLIPGLEEFPSPFPKSHPFSYFRMSGNSFQEITSCTLIYSPPRKIHFPLQSWHNPMRILYWRIKSRAGKARWPEHSWTKSRGKMTTTYKTTPGCVRSHLRHPKTWVKKCVSRKIHPVINFWEYNNIYNVHAMGQNHSDFPSELPKSEPI